MLDERRDGQQPASPNEEKAYRLRCCLLMGLFILGCGPSRPESEAQADSHQQMLNALRKIYDATEENNHYLGE